MKYEELVTLSKWKLKVMGHDLLKVYILLDLHRGLKKEKQHAYDKLARKLRVKEPQAHFGAMDTREEIADAIICLRKMIKARKKKLTLWGKQKPVYVKNIEFALNLTEIQKNIGKLN